MPSLSPLHVPSPSPSCAHPWGDIDNDDNDPIDSDVEDSKYLWDIYAGLKPLPLDIVMLDAETDDEGEIKDDLP
jgi:hypothetical protein